MYKIIIFVVAFDFGNVSRRCCQRAVELEQELQNRGMLPEILVTGGFSNPHNQNIGEFMYCALVELGAKNPKKGDATQFNTEGEVVELWKHLNNQTPLTIYVVNKWWHLPRTRLLLWWHQPRGIHTKYRWIPIKHWYRGCLPHELMAIPQNLWRMFKRDHLPKRFRG